MEEKKGFVQEFKEFVMRGNVMDLAVAVIIGAAFQKIIASLVDDVIMPVIGLLTGGIDFSNYFIALDGNSYTTLAEARAAGAATVSYGVFVNAVINFLLVAFAVFLLVKGINKIQSKVAKPKEEVVDTKTCPYCKSTIPIEAVRCPNCTSEVPLEEEAEIV